MKKMSFICSVLSFAIMLPVTFAKDRSEKKTDAEMRQQMAEMHQKAADCLKSNRPMKECHQEMMQNCPMMGKKGNHSQVCLQDEQSGMMGEDHMGMMKKKNRNG